MDGEGRSQVDYYTIRVSNPSSSGEAYFIVSAIAACTYNTGLSSYTYITQYITWASHAFWIDLVTLHTSVIQYTSRHIAKASWNIHPTTRLAPARISVASSKNMQHSPNPSHTTSLNLNKNDIQLHMSAIKINSKC